MEARRDKKGCAIPDLEDKEAKDWVIDQLQRHAEESPNLAANFDATLILILNMGKEYEATFPPTKGEENMRYSASAYFSAYVNELVGNLFIVQTNSFEEVAKKINLASIAARIYLEGRMNPGRFIGYPIIKILVRNDSIQADLWIDTMRQRSEKVRSIPANLLDAIIDDADNVQAFVTSIDNYIPKATLDLRKFKF